MDEFTFGLLRMQVCWQRAHFKVMKNVEVPSSNEGFLFGSVFVFGPKIHKSAIG